MRHDGLPPRALALTFSLSALWGGNPVAVKAGLRDAPPLRLGWMRFVLGGAVVAAWAVYRRESLRPAREEWRPLLGLGALFSAQILLMNVGQDHTSAGHAAVLMSAYPLWTSVLAHFLVPGDRLTRGRLAGALVAYGGVVVVFSASLLNPGARGLEASLAGDAMLAVSAFLLGARQIVLARTSQTIAIERLLMAQAVVGGLSFGAASAAFETEPTVYGLRLALALGYQGILIAGLAFLVQTWLLKRYPPSRVTMVYLTQPLFGVLFSWLVLGERVGPELYLGALLVISGSYFVQRQS